MEINISNGLFALSSWFFKIGTRNCYRMWKTRLQKTFSIIFESQFGITIPKIQNLCFASQTTHLRFPPNYMHLFQCDNEYSFLIYMEQHCMSTLGSKHTIWNEGHENKLKILYFSRRSWLMQTLRGPFREGIFVWNPRIHRKSHLWNKYSEISINTASWKNL